MVKNSDLIAEFLKERKIEIAFGIIGSANAHIFDSVTQLGYTKIVCVHHEQAAVMAAGSYYRSSGKMSAVLVTAGAGSSNAITGVLSNWADSIPCMIISGQEKSTDVKEYKAYDRRMFGIQGYDSPFAVSKMTKFAKTVLNPNDLQSILELAYDSALRGRPGPVWIDVPSDIQGTNVNSQPWKKSDIKMYDYDINRADSVVPWIENSQRPVIIAGHGIKLSGAKQEFLDLVDKLQIPVIHTWSAMDLLSDDHLYNFGKSGVMGQRSANFIIQNSDLVLSIGSRLSIFQTGYDRDGFAPNAKIIVVDIDPTENKECIDTFIEEDCKAFIENLLEHGNIDSYREDWLVYCHGIFNKYPLLMEEHKNEEEYINSYKFLQTVHRLMPDDAIITTDMGTALLSGFYMISPTKNQQMFTSLGLGEMGFGLPSAIGAAFANPDNPIICLNCDGGMMMNLQELQTITANHLNIKIVVFDNDGYLMIKHTQNLLFKGRQTCVDKSTGVTVPNFSKVATAFDIPSYQIKLGDDVEKIWKEFQSGEGPALCEVFMSPDQDFIPKVKPLSVGNKIIPAPLEEMSPLLPIGEVKQNMLDTSWVSKRITDD